MIVPGHRPAPSDPGTNRWLVLGICSMSLFIVGLDASGLNLALPSIQQQLDVPPSQLQWILDAYTLVIAGLLMLSGSVADRVGRRRVFRIGLVLFGVGSVLCAFSLSGEQLIASRAIQAVGGSMLNPVALSIITNTFIDPRERAQAIGVWGSTIGVSMALGPLIGGVLVETTGWRGVFWMNVPVVLLALVLTTRYVPESRAEQRRPLDPTGQLLIMLALGTLTFAIIEGRGASWTSTLVIGCVLASLVFLVAFVVVERRTTHPLIDPGFFVSLPFSGAVVSAIIGFACQGGFLLLNTLYLQSARGFSALHAGLLTLPMALCTAICAPISGRLVGSSGVRTPMVLASVGIGGSALVLTRLTLETSVPVLVTAYVLFGIGFGMLNAPITNSAVSGMPRSQAGVASAVASTSRQIGMALGVAVYGTLAFGALPSDGAGTWSEPAAFTAATHPAWWTILGCAVALLGVAFVVTSRAATRSVERVSAALSEPDSRSRPDRQEP